MLRFKKYSYILIMGIVNEINKEDLKNHLIDLEARIQAKIRHICLTNRKLPFERLSKGRQLKETVRQTIKYLDEGNHERVAEYIENLGSRGVKIDFNSFKKHSSRA